MEQNKIKSLAGLVEQMADVLKVSHKVSAAIIVKRETALTAYNEWKSKQSK